MIDKTDRPHIVLSCWSVLVVASAHLLLYELERVGRHGLRHDVAGHPLQAVLEFVARHSLEYALLLNYLGNTAVLLLLIIDEGGRCNLASVLAVVHHAATAATTKNSHLIFVLLLRARLDLPLLHVAAAAASDHHSDAIVAAVPPVKPVDHEGHISSAILLLLEVIELQFGKSIPILTFAINPDGSVVDLSWLGLTLRHVLIIYLDNIASDHLAGVHLLLLLLCKCHDLAHGHLNL